MLDINKLRKSDHKIIAIGAHGPILQSMLDFDYLAGKSQPSLVGIVATGRKYERLFYGKKDMLIPVYESFEAIPSSIVKDITLFLNLTSGRRTLSTSLEAFDELPHVLGGAIFAENVPEQHALQIYQKTQDPIGRSSLQDDKGRFVIGPATVGLLIPQLIKLGAIGGTQAKQLIDSHLFEAGNVAVLSSSGGMVNELIRLVTSQGKRISFSLAFGGDRFPVLTPKEAFLAAEEDKSTDYIVYFGELGGYDEYELAELLKQNKVTKKVITYIAGTISEMFETPPQFGHAKAMASRGEEAALAKRKALKKAGAQVAESFTEFIEMVKKIKSQSNQKIFLGDQLAGTFESKTSSSQRSLQSSQINTKLKRPLKELAQTTDTDKYFSNLLDTLSTRKHALFMNSVSSDEGGVAKIMGEDLLKVATTQSFGFIVASMLLGKKTVSKDLENFTELVLKLLVDHGPYVSGAVNTMITARAGKDLVSSLVSGLLTIGPRFGGAINEAALNWFTGVNENKKVYEFVEDFAKNRRYISGIGHRKYRIDFLDPRVEKILSFTKTLKNPKYTKFALEIQGITTAKKGNLILNVDGAIAAVLLDILSEKEKYSPEQLQETIETELFNAFFVLSRSVGFVAHYLDQRRLDEGLFRLPTDEVVSFR